MSWHHLENPRQPKLLSISRKEPLGSGWRAAVALMPRVGSEELVDLSHLGFPLKFGLYSLFFFLFRLYSSFSHSAFFIHCYLLQKLFLAVSATVCPWGLTDCWGLLSLLLHSCR